MLTYTDASYVNKPYSPTACVPVLATVFLMLPDACPANTWPYRPVDEIVLWVVMTEDVPVNCGPVRTPLAVVVLCVLFTAEVARYVAVVLVPAAFDVFLTTIVEPANTAGPVDVPAEDIIWWLTVNSATPPLDG